MTESQKKDERQWSGGDSFLLMISQGCLLEEFMFLASNSFCSSRGREMIHVGPAQQ